MMDVVRNIFENRDINSQQKSILVCLVSFSRDDALSIEKISKKTSLSYSTVIRNLDSLKVMGLIYNSNPTNVGKGKVKSYAVTLLAFKDFDDLSVSETKANQSNEKLDENKLLITSELKQTNHLNFKETVSETNVTTISETDNSVSKTELKKINTGQYIYNNVDQIDQIKDLIIDHDQEKIINLKKAKQLSPNIHYTKLTKVQNLSNSPKEMDTVLSELKGRGVIPSSKFTCVPNSDISEASSILEILIYMGVSRSEAKRWIEALGAEKLFYLKGNFDEWRKKNPFPIRQQPGAIFRGWVMEEIEIQNGQRPPRTQIAYSASY